VSKNYEVKLELFEGPLDLLLYLVSKDEVQIADISVSRITEQYLEYLNVMRVLNIDIAADYLHMASTLLRLKARELLPSTENDPEEFESEEGIYNRQQLVEKLLEHKKFKEAAQSLRTYEAAQFGSFTRGEAEEVEVALDDEEVFIGDVGIFDLISCFQRILQQAKEVKPQHIVRVDNVKIDDRIDHILGILSDKKQEQVAFEELFYDDNRRIVLVVTFMALLELIKMQQITIHQHQQFGPIFIRHRSEQSREGNL